MERGSLETAVTRKRLVYNLRRRRDREAVLLGTHLVRGERVWWLAHDIWRQLAEPKNYRAGVMAHHAAVAGTGRGAVLRVLERFLEEIDAALAQIDRPRLRARHWGFAEETAAITRAEWRAVDRVIVQFERILAGKPARRRPLKPKPNATVLTGPWPTATRPARARPPATGGRKPTPPLFPTVPPQD